MSSSLPVVGKVPHESLWLEGFGLVPVAGGALLVGGNAWFPDGIGATCRPSDTVLFWERATRQWHPLPPLPQPRMGHATVALPDGRVRVLGGKTPEAHESRDTLVWEPGSRRFQDGPPLLAARSGPIAVGFADGAVLVLGTDFDEDFERGTRSEFLGPEAEAWEPAGQTARLFHPGPVCVSGSRALIAGGRDNGFGFAIVEGVHSAPPLDQMTEVWDRERRVWRQALPLTESRDGALGVTLSDGRVLVVGGWRQGRVLASAEVWDPRTEAWSATGSLATPRSGFALTALAGGRALVFGGLTETSDTGTPTVELWDPLQGTWSPGTPLRIERAGQQLVEVDPGRFLVVGCTRTPDGGLETTWELWEA
ncbi:Kelch repeat-containing protein [Melittangium boletus]|uniref:Kelch repeat-containing protein n=1 Tax=Melittangium boletus TaxID=83453 RepID=UPI003DA5B35E